MRADTAVGRLVLNTLVGVALVLLVVFLYSGCRVLDDIVNGRVPVRVRQ